LKPPLEETRWEVKGDSPGDVIELKNHIISLVAIFMALALGLLLGHSMDGGGQLAREREDIVSRLEAEFERLRTENQRFKERTEALQATLDVYKRFEEHVCSAVLEGLLEGRCVGIVQLAQEPVPAGLVRCIEMAGGEVAFQAAVSLDWPGNQKGSLSMAENARLLGKALAGSEGSDLMSFVEMRALTLAGAPKRPDAMVILGGGYGASRVRSLDLPLVEAMIEEGVLVVGGELSDARQSVIPYYQSTGIATVDSLDSPFGQIAVAFLLEGIQGHYGLKTTAEALTPLKRR